MNQLKDLLATGDPCARESLPEDAIRARLRAAVLSASRGRVHSPGRRSVMRVAMAAAATVALAGAVSATRLWRAVDAPAYAAVRFEVKLAEDVPAPGLREAPVGTQPKVVYLHEETVVSNADIVACGVVPGVNAGHYDVEIRLSADGAARLREATRQHVGRPVAIVIDGLVAMAPIVRSEVGELGRITGNYSRSEADRLVRGMTPR